MDRSRIARFLLAAMLFSTSAFAGPVAEHRNVAATVSGVYSVNFNLNIQSTLPANSAVVCKVQIAPPAFFSNLNPQAAAAPVETASGVAAVTGSTATCLVEIPFSWTVETMRGGVVLNYEIDAVNASGTLPALVRTSIQQGIAEPYPAPGGASTLNFNVTF